MKLHSAAQRKMAVDDHAYGIARAQLGCGCSANVALKRDVVHKISGELKTIGENQYAAAQDAHLHDFVAIAVAPSNPEIRKVGLGDFDFRGKAVIRCAYVTVQSGLSASVHSDYWLQTRFQPDRRIRFGIRSLLGDRQRVALNARGLLRNRQ